MLLVKVIRKFTDKDRIVREIGEQMVIDDRRFEVLSHDNKYGHRYVELATVNEIKAYLDKKGIEYPNKARKDELLELLG